MAVKVKKKKKKKFGATAFSSGGGSRGREQSPLRPKHAEKTPPCHDTCPSGNKIREFVRTLAYAETLGKSTQQALEEAWGIYTDTSPFPSVCGRVCPHPCEEKCNRKELEGPININQIERAIGDFGLEKGLALKALTDEKRSEKVAVVGGGPGGLSCAYQLARRGYGVTVFEASDKAGGMLRWGIPRYRLPADVLDGEIQKILDLGVELKCDTRIGKEISLDDLRTQYQAVFVAIGAEKGLKLRVEGEEAENVYSGVDFLNRIHHGETVDVGDDVIVVGGGDTAIDAARICKRLGSNVTILYRRTIKEMPAIDQEIEEAEEEGIKLEYLAAPIGFNTDNGRITTMKCIRMELGEPDNSGRRRPVPIKGSEFEIPASAVIPAISQAPDFNGFESLIQDKDWIQIDDFCASTKVDGVYGGGDAVSLALATTAIGHGRRAADTIVKKLQGLEVEAEAGPPLITLDRMRLDHYEKLDRVEATVLPVEERLAELEKEVNLPLSIEQAFGESKRCMSCGNCFFCEKCWLFCQDQAVDKPMEKGVLYHFKMENCTGCKKCDEECPCGFIDMQ